MGVKRAPSSIYKDPRWKVVRLEAKRRDGWRCVKCEAVGRLEVDHIKRVKDFPELAYELSNLQSLCGICHSRKTAIETGIAPLSPNRAAWRELLRQGAPQPKESTCLLQ
ncbi:HNH endonuclease signature motif containing protein [Bradyrhizobium sp. 27S5]|uniref:HNH endonuclease n=1 Tax=Bradyrhizobium sp. 27S5 TaxID=3139728 RepID=UPI0030D1F3F6